MDETHRRFVERNLDECDSSLADKPNLAAVFHEQWRKEHREKVLNVNSWTDVSYPSAYSKHHQDRFYPPDYQQRLEEGASILLPKLDAGERTHFVKRLRGNGGLSAEEELLLARGFARTLGPDSLSFPTVPRDHDRPEFHVSVAGRQVEVEARGLMDSAEVRELNEHAIHSGEMGWVSWNPSIGDVQRLRVAAAKKLLSGQTGDARILVLTQYTPWIHPHDGVVMLREMAVSPESFDIAPAQHPLAVAYVTGRWIAGVWFNQGVVARIGIDSAQKEFLRNAVREAFYPRRDGILFDEGNDHVRQDELIAQMIRAAAGG